MSEVEWSDRPQLTQQGLAPIAFLIGDWTGTGTCDGQPTRARLVVEAIFGGTFLEARETLYRPDGAIDHEDRVFYRYAVEDQTIRALHLQAPAWMADRYVNLLDDRDGLMWSGGPASPRVRIVHEAAQLDVQVWLPDATEPASHIVYTPTPQGSEP